MDLISFRLATSGFSAIKGIFDLKILVSVFSLPGIGVIKTIASNFFSLFKKVSISV